VVLAAISVGSAIHSANAAVRSVDEAFGGVAGGEMVRQFGPSYSLGIGAYLAMICAVYLAWRAFKNE
jgi:predicted MFS family arabinose efflux permease